MCPLIFAWHSLTDMFILIIRANISWTQSIEKQKQYDTRKPRHPNQQLRHSSDTYVLGSEWMRPWFWIRPLTWGSWTQWVLRFGPSRRFGGVFCHRTHCISQTLVSSGPLLQERIGHWVPSRWWRRRALQVYTKILRRSTLAIQSQFVPLALRSSRGHRLLWRQRHGVLQERCIHRPLALSWRKCTLLVTVSWFIIQVKMGFHRKINQIENDKKRVNQCN